MSETRFYTWQKYQCAYEIIGENKMGTPLLLLHPIGVGLSRHFWQRFCQTLTQQGYPNPIYNPDLLGCGESAMPKIAYYPEDWAKQLQYFTENIIKKPVILVVQGALFPVAIYCTQKFPHLIKGLILSGPPAWQLMTKPTKPRQQKIAWNLFDTPLGNGFYRYARRQQFLQSFSIRQLFGDKEKVDREWLEELNKGSQDLESRHAVFSFLAGFWREDYQQAIATITQPTLVIFGETASSISSPGALETPQERLNSYLKHLSNGSGTVIPGRNVLPYENTEEFVTAISDFIRAFP